MTIAMPPGVNAIMTGVPTLCDAVWDGIGDAVRRHCRADGGGIVLGIDRGPIERSGAGLSDDVIAGLDHDLAAAGHATVATTRIADLHLAAARIDTDDWLGMLWVARRDGTFAADDLAALRWYATAGIELARPMAIERQQADLLRLETQHRSVNDLQLISSLLAHQSRSTDDATSRRAIGTVADRVFALTRVRQQPTGDIGSALQACCTALRAQVEHRGIIMDLVIDRAMPPIDERRITVLTIAVNELATNAIKHAFAHRDRGTITIMLRASADHVHVSVEDDGIPLPPSGPPGRHGSGVDLIQRLVNGIRGTLSLPDQGSKRFSITIPVSRIGAGVVQTGSAR